MESEMNVEKIEAAILQNVSYPDMDPKGLRDAALAILALLPAPDAQAERIAELEKALADETEACAKIAECHFDDRGNGRSGHYSETDWTDGYRDATRGAASAIRARAALRQTEPTP
jgi:hypothetical protein